MKQLAAKAELPHPITWQQKQTRIFNALSEDKTVKGNDDVGYLSGEFVTLRRRKTVDTGNN